MVFDDDILGLDGKTLDFVCRDPANPHRVSDQLLRWHFRQSVLANVRGAGEPIFEHDFPPGDGYDERDPRRAMCGGKVRNGDCV